jgi:hypothetical protein
MRAPSRRRARRGGPPRRRIVGRVQGAEVVIKVRDNVPYEISGR